MTWYKLIVGDALKILPTLDKNVGLVFTSPPYNVGTDYDIYDDSNPLNEYIDWLLDVFKEMWEILVPGGHIVINLANTGRQPYTPVSDLFSSKVWYANLPDLETRAEIIWDKQNVTGLTAWGSWMSANKPSIRDQHEYLQVWRKRGKRSGKSTIARDEFLTYTKSIWKMSPEGRRKLHPAPFPEKLAEAVIQLYSFEDEIVLDPFVGSGTTCLVAYKLNRNSIGIDISEKYVENARKRIEKFRRKTTLDGFIEN